MSFLAYDLTFLVLFSVIVGSFLWINRRKLKKDGIMFLYKTSIGLKLINYFGTRYKKTLKFLSYVSITVGYFLMVGGVYLLIQLVYLFTKPEFVKAVKVPPIMPLIPYLPALFKVDWLPPFYFTYWIVAIALVAIFHEGFHGIFAKFYNIKIKSTGFGFLGPFLAFFVEQDDKQMQKAKPFAQMSVLSAGVFANVLLAIVFLIGMGFYFNSFYAPSGAIFSDYTYSVVPLSAMINMHIINSSELSDFNMTKINLNNKSYFISNKFFALNLTKKQIAEDNSTAVKLYWDEPAIKLKMKGVIVTINNQKITMPGDISKVLSTMKVGEVIQIKTIYSDSSGESNESYYLALGADYINKTRPIIGIASLQLKQTTFLKSLIYNIMTTFRDPAVDYQPRANAELTIFIYTLLWWIFWINISVALANMIPFGIFDGGRFFYLTIFAVTKKKKLSESIFKWTSRILLGLVALSMVLWLFGIF